GPSSAAAAGGAVHRAVRAAQGLPVRPGIPAAVATGTVAYRQGRCAGEASHSPVGGARVAVGGDTDLSGRAADPGGGPLRPGVLPLVRPLAVPAGRLPLRPANAHRDRGTHPAVARRARPVPAAADRPGFGPFRGGAGPMAADRRRRPFSARGAPRPV